MAIMYPKSLDEYVPTDSEKLVYYSLKTQLPDQFEVFYSVSWSELEKGKRLINSEADFVVLDPEQGFICLEVKGGNVRVHDGEWYVSDSFHGERHLNVSPYEQAEKSMYHFIKVYANRYNYTYKGTYGAGVVFPFTYLGQEIELDNRSRECTIDKNDMNNLYPKIKRIFKVWSGDKYGSMLYSPTQHQFFSELLKENLAIAASSGALTEYKERELAVINRVQDNYVFLLKGIRQLLIRGGAGTGKTWIAMKMANKSASLKNNRVLFVCVSKHLCKMVRETVVPDVEVYSLENLFSDGIQDFTNLQDFEFNNTNKLVPGYCKFDAIYVDEAQDFKEEWATALLLFLKDRGKSRLAVFYDEIQVLRNNSFGNGFGKNLPLFYLNENIRNTANIYKWATSETNLGTDVIANPVEGPTPQKETISNQMQLTHRLEVLFRRFLDDEHLPNTAMVILVESATEFLSEHPDGIAKWSFSYDVPTKENQIRIASVEDYKGLEADVIIYIHSEYSSKNMNYIAYTRAKFYLLEIIRRF